MDFVAVVICSTLVCQRRRNKAHEDKNLLLLLDVTSVQMKNKIAEPSN